MTKFNPDFWELTVSEASWGQFSTADGLHYEAPGEAERRHAREETAKAFWLKVRDILEEVLTERQREILRLYFFEGMNQREIAARLRIAQQSVSEHLYGKLRDGHSVGGAIRKLRKACAKRGVRFAFPSPDD